MIKPTFMVPTLKPVFANPISSRVWREIGNHSNGPPAGVERYQNIFFAKGAFKYCSLANSRVILRKNGRVNFGINECHDWNRCRKHPPYSKTTATRRRSLGQICMNVYQWPY